MAARADRPVPAQESRALVADKVVPAVAASAPQLVKVSYKVKRGDTLGSIAQGFRTSVSSIQRWNNLRGSRITAGDQLTIYTNRAR